MEEIKVEELQEEIINKCFQNTDEDYLVVLEALEEEKEIKNYV